MKPIQFDGLSYNREESLELRQTMIDLRNEALKQADFGYAVSLSHVVAWMAVVIDERWPLT